ncbi:MAG: UMP kinase [Halobacteria archaeon]|nr:UMP kinase [Halobacteria archaeon]
MDIVVSIGGSVLVPDLSSETVSRYARAIERISDDHSLSVVVGGGKTARDYIDVARDLGANDSICDYMGIDVTRINARLLISALPESAYPEPPTSYREAEDALADDKVPIMGGMAPGQTTDAVAAVFSEYTNADLLVYATSVDGVYTSDPSSDDDAERFDRLTPEELVEVVMQTQLSAGSNSVVDALAAKIIERSGVRTLVLDGTDPENLEDAVLEGVHTGTEVVPEGYSESQGVLDDF